MSGLTEVVFDRPDSVTGWSAIDDRVMGGVSSSRMRFEPAGMTDDAATAAFRTAMNDPATLRRQLRLNSSRIALGKIWFCLVNDGASEAITSSLRSLRVTGVTGSSD